PCLCLACCGVLRDLHPFPTRRSSDLQRINSPAFLLYRAKHLVIDCIKRGHIEQPPPDTGLIGCCYHPVTGMGQSRDCLQTARDRSEEHTSELQSRENLVCRLLLEKKH